MNEILKDLSVIVFFPILRSVSGWAVHALEDNKITEFEWKQLASTIIRLGTMGLTGYFGLSLTGMENAALVSAVGAFFADKLFNAIKKKNK